jgi:hypothetical protein
MIAVFVKLEPMNSLFSVSYFRAFECLRFDGGYLEFVFDPLFDNFFEILQGLSLHVMIKTFLLLFGIKQHRILTIWLHIKGKLALKSDKTICIILL